MLPGVGGVENERRWEKGFGREVFFMSQGRVDVDEGGQAVGAEQFFGVGCVAGGWERVAGAEIINGQVAFPRLQLSVTVAGLFFVQINFDLGVAFGELLQDRRHHGKGEQGRLQ